MRVLVTRPEREARHTAARLKALGHEAIVDPALVVERLPFTLPAETFDAVAITSANALLAGESLSGLFDLPLFAVGARSAEAARAAGFREVAASGGGAAALAGALAKAFPSGARVLYLAGEDRAQDLAALAGPRIKIETKVIYRAAPSPELGRDTAARFRAGEIDAVLHYSARSAAIFLDLVRRANLMESAAGARHLCLSDAVAAPLRAASLNVKVAARPAEDALFALIG